MSEYQAPIADMKFVIENLAGLDQMPAAGATIFVGAPSHKRGTGGPARIIAVV